MDKVNVGIVGCGWFGNFHLDHLLQNENAEVVALATGNREKLLNTAKKAPNAHLYATYQEMLEGENRLDAMVVCVPPHRHGNIETDAAAKGVNLYVEKPLGISYREAQRNLEAIQKSGILCAVGYQERYAQGIEELKSRLAGQKIGIIHGKWMGNTPGAPWWRKKDCSGGQIVEQCTHVMDLMRYLCGDAQSVFAMEKRGMFPDYEDKTVEDCSIALINLENGATADVITGCYHDKTKVLSDIGLTFYLRDARIHYAWEKGITYATACEERFVPADGGNHTRSLYAFIEAVQKKDPSLIRSSYEDAMKTFRLTLAVNRSMEEKRLVPVSEITE